MEATQTAPADFLTGRAMSVIQPRPVPFQSAVETSASIGEDSLVDRPDLIAELHRYLGEAGMLGPRRHARSWRYRLKALVTFL
jgi:hypothetical protein